MKRLLFIPTIFACILFTFISCEQVIEMDVPERNPLIVLYSVLEADSVLRVQLTSSRYVTDDRPIDYIHNAQLRLMAGGEEVGSWQFLDNGVYELQGYKLVSKNTYKIVAEAPGFTSVSAEAYLTGATKAPEVLRIDTLQKGDNEQTVRFRIAMEDDPETTDFYRVQLMHSYNNYRYEQDANGNIVVVDTIRSTVMSPISSSFGEFNSISNLVTVCSYYSSFNGCSVMFNDQLLKEKTFTFDIFHHQYYFNPGMGNENPDQQDEYYLVFSRINRDYYQYILSADKNYTYSDNPFAEPSSLYSNIEGGYGVFGASAAVLVRIR
jgi:hypothetical protein